MNSPEQKDYIALHLPGIPVISVIFSPQAACLPNVPFMVLKQPTGIN